MTLRVGIGYDSLALTASSLSPSPDTNVSTSPAGGEVRDETFKQRVQTKNKTTAYYIKQCE